MKKANLIRTYYTDLEKLIVKYKEEIVNDLDKQMNIKNNSKEMFDDSENAKGLIYILKVGDGLYKLKYISEKKKKKI